MISGENSHMDGEKGTKLSNGRHLGATYENNVHLLDEGPDNNEEDRMAAQLMGCIAQKRCQDVRVLLQVPHIISGNAYPYSQFLP